MAKIRVGFSSDFNVKGNNVGFGTTNPTALLNVVVVQHLHGHAGAALTVHTEFDYRLGDPAMSICVGPADADRLTKLKRKLATLELYVAC